MKTYVFEGKNVEELTLQALKELNVNYQTFIINEWQNTNYVRKI